MIAICITHYYKEKELLLLIEQIKTIGYGEFRVFIHDNGSVNLEVKETDIISYYKSQKNNGVIESRKIFLNKYNAEYYVFLDDDLYLEMDFFDCLYKEIKTADDVMAFKVYDENYNVRKFEYISNKLEPHKSFKFLGGACCLKKGIATQLYKELYDSFYGMEEYELALLLYQNGGRISYRPSIKVHHLKSETSIPMLSSRYSNECEKAVKKIYIILKYYPRIFAILPLFAWIMKCLYSKNVNRLSNMEFIKTIKDGNSFFK
jgi:GT2 family glycosyltransferase